MKFGVLGWGLRSPVAQLAHRPDLGHELAVLADPREYARAKFKEANPQADAVDSIEELLSRDLDAVFVLTPDWLHEEHAIACLEAGKTIFLEKPMAVTAAGCDRILEARRRIGGRIYAGHNMRWFPVIRKMKEFIDQGAVGNVKAAWCRQYVAYGGEAYFCDWHADRKNTNGLLLQKGAHDIDILHWLCGSYSKRVVGMGGLEVYGQNQTRETFEEYENDHFRDTWPPSSLDRVNPGADIEDLNMILMELQNGVKASYQQCQFSPDSWRNYTLIGCRRRRAWRC
jgi:predicted dehydrogenase